MCDSNTPSPEPLRAAYTRAELIETARNWLRENYPVENTAKSANKFMTRLGLLVDFITDHFPEQT